MGWRARPLLLPSLGLAIVTMVVVVVTVVVVVVVMVAVRRAYKLHTIALTSAILKLRRPRVRPRLRLDPSAIDLFSVGDTRGGGGKRAEKRKMTDRSFRDAMPLNERVSRGLPRSCTSSMK